MLSTLLALLVIGIVAVAVLSIVGAVLGLAVGLLFKLLPLLLIGYIVLRVLTPKPKQLSAEDRKWLES